MKLGGEDYSPGLLKKIEYAGGNARSFQTAAQSLERLAECSISARHVERVTERLGKERAGERDRAAAAMEARKLRADYKEPPAVAVVMLDAGKAQFRREDAGPGVHEPRWGDTKVACLQTYTDVQYQQDPQPEPPPARQFFRERHYQGIRLCGFESYHGFAWAAERPQGVCHGWSAK